MMKSNLMFGVLFTSQLYLRNLPEPIIIDEPVFEETKTVDDYEVYRQTVYTVVENNEVQLGSGHRYGDNDIRNINNVMHYNDAEYGWLPIIAINIDEVYASGLNERGTPNIYGSVVELTYPNGDSTNAIILDACGACSKDAKVDMWAYKLDYDMDIDGVKMKRIRNGYVQE